MAAPAQIAQLGTLQSQFALQVGKFKKAQKQYQSLIQANGQLETQLNENTLVKEELDLVKDDDAVVYKMLGPILVRQTITEARDTINNRIKYIEGEMKKNKEMLDSNKSTVDSEREAIAKIEDQIQKLFIKTQLSGPPS